MYQSSHYTLRRDLSDKIIVPLFVIALNIEFGVRSLNLESWVVSLSVSFNFVPGHCTLFVPGYIFVPAPAGGYIFVPAPASGYKNVPGPESDSRKN